MSGFVLAVGAAILFITATTTSQSSAATTYYSQKSRLSLVRSSAATTHKKAIRPAGDIASKQQAQPNLAASNSDTPCKRGSVMNVVAHEDDDILFINPAIQNAITAGKCITTVFMTSGDAGQSAAYAEHRIDGMQAAYAAMAGSANSWTASTVELHGHLVQRYSLAATPQITLLFFNLPDGDLDGSGFAANDHQSLKQIRFDPSVRIVSRYDQTSYNTAELVATISELLTKNQPTVINTQAYDAVETTDDHSDHQAVGFFVTSAAEQVKLQGRVNHYLGYQINSLPPNLSDTEAAAKRYIFMIYAAHDGFICNAETRCTNEFTYVHYFNRQYQQHPY